MAAKAAKVNAMERSKEDDTSFHFLSEETLYKDVVPKKNRDSSSSDNIIDTSDETLNTNFQDLNVFDGLVGERDHDDCNRERLHERDRRSREKETAVIHLSCLHLRLLEVQEWWIH